MAIDAWARPQRHHEVGAVEGALRAVLERHPSAIVAAFDASTATTRVPLPASLAAIEQRVTSEETSIDLVVPADRATVVRLWHRARTNGSASAPVRLQRSPDEPGRLHVFDLRSRHGVMVFAFVEAAAAGDAADESGEPPPLRPRFARASKDASAVYRHVDPALTDILGWPADELIGHRTIEFVHADDQDVAIANWMEMLDTPGQGRAIRVRHRHRDGSWVWLEVTNHNRLDEREGDILTEIVDISEEMAANDAVRAREQLLAQLTESVPVGLFHADTQGRVLYANRRLHELTGTAGAVAIAQQLRAVLAEDRPAVEAALAAAAGGADADIEIGLRAPGGTLRHCTLRVRPLRGDDGAVAGVTGCIEDVTAMVLSRRELEVKAACDALTGCLNREVTMAALQDVLDRKDARGGSDRGAAVIFVDLDGFKQVNDELGHAAGDDCLVAVASRLRASIRAGDLLGRFGGDEFVVVCPDVTSPAVALEIARSIARRAFASTASPTEAGSFPVRASIGVSWAGAGAADAAVVVAAADAAMYESKRAGLGEPVLAA